MQSRPVMPRTRPVCMRRPDRWYVDCVDGKRLQILKLAIGAAAGQTQQAPPPALSKQPLALT